MPVVPSFATMLTRVEPETSQRRPGVVVVNTNAGLSSRGVDLSVVFPGWPVLEVGPDLDQQLRSAISDGVEVIGVWGGDGTIRAVASLIAGTDVAMLPGPGGTHNHFALAMGLDTEERVRDAVGGGTIRRIDAAYANDELFLNNSSLGWYAQLLRRREHYERRLPRLVAKLASMVIEAAVVHRMHVKVSDRPTRSTWMIWVGNGRYGLSPEDVAERADMSDGLLDIRALTAANRLPKLRAAVRFLHRSIETSSLLDRSLTSEATVTVRRRHHVDVTLDGEIKRLALPIRFRVARGAVNVVTMTGEDNAHGV